MQSATSSQKGGGPLSPPALPPMTEEKFSPSSQTVDNREKMLKTRHSAKRPRTGGAAPAKGKNEPTMPKIESVTPHESEKREETPIAVQPSEISAMPEERSIKSAPAPDAMTQISGKPSEMPPESAAPGGIIASGTSPPPTAGDQDESLPRERTQEVVSRDELAANVMTAEDQRSPSPESLPRKPASSVAPSA